MSVKNREKSQWFACSGPVPTATFRLFCFPYAGGSAGTYRTWWNALAPDVEVRPLQLPGRGERFRESAFTSLNPLVKLLTDVISDYLDLPFAFFGHSMGATIGFELAHELIRRRQPLPRHLFVSGRRAPRALREEPLTYGLPEAEFINELRQLEGTPPEVLNNSELLSLLLPLLRADFELIETYQYTCRPRLQCPITAFGGMQDKHISFDDLDAWREETRGEFKLRMLPGNHFFLQDSESEILTTVATTVQTTLR